MELTQPSSGLGVRLNTHLHLGPKLRMSGAVLLLALHSFITWTEKILPLWEIC